MVFESFIFLEATSHTATWGMSRPMVAEQLIHGRQTLFMFFVLPYPHSNCDTNASTILKNHRFFRGTGMDWVSNPQSWIHSQLDTNPVQPIIDGPSFGIHLVSGTGIFGALSISALADVTHLRPWKAHWSTISTCLIYTSTKVYICVHVLHIDLYIIHMLYFIYLCICVHISVYIHIYIYVYQQYVCVWLYMYILPACMYSPYSWCNIIELIIQLIPR